MLLKKRHIVILMLAAAAIGVSLVLVPSQKEMVLMRFKSDRFADAYRLYQAQLAEGDLSLSTTNNLVDVYLQAGKVNDAIKVLETFVSLHPRQLQARKKLGLLYQYAKREDDYIRNLEAMNELAPSAETLEKLSQAYNYTKQYDKQASVLETISKQQPNTKALEDLVGLYSYTRQYGKEADALKKLIALENGKNPSRYIDLANTYAAIHAYPDAINALRTLHAKFPDQFTFKAADMLVEYLLDEKKPNEAVTEATGWVEKHNDADEGAKLIALIHFKIDADTARALLRHFTNTQINGSGPLLEQYVLLESDQHKDEVYQRLKSLETAGDLPSQVNKHLLFMAEDHQERNIARDIVSCMNLTALSEEELLSLVELAQSKDDAGMLATIKSAFPPSEYAKDRPVLLVVLAIVMHDADAPNALKKLDAQNLSSPDALHVARVCAHVKNYDCTNHFLAKIQSNEGLSDTEIAAIGSLYFHMNEQDKGYLYIASAMKTNSSPAVKAVAVQYDAARGDNAKVAAWLKANPGADKQSLADLYYAAANHHQPATAVIVAEAFYKHYNFPLARTLLADAYVKTGRFEEAVNLLRPGTPLDETDEDNYVNALAALSAKNAYRKELGQYVALRLATDIPEHRKLSLTYIAIGAHAEPYVMPYIHKLAETDGGQWAIFYATQMDKEGRHDEARPFWVKVAHDPKTRPKEKLDIAYALLSYGYKADAEDIFFMLAKNAPADSDVVKSLVYVWGPRPTAMQMSWVEERFTQAKGEEKQRWAKLLADIADDDAVISLAHSQPKSLDNDALAMRYFEALGARGQLAAQEKILTAAAQSTHQTKRLRQFALAAEASNLPSEAERAWKTILALNPQDSEAMLKAGTLALSQGETTAAGKYLGAYMHSAAWLRSPPKDIYQAFFAYAELLRNQHHMDEAKKYYGLAIKSVDSGKLETADAQSAKAQSQVRLGDVTDGMNTFEDAVAADPGNANLRADWISVLLDIGRYDDAKNLLAVPPDASSGRTLTPVALPPGMVISYALHNGGRELLLTMAQPVKGNVMLSPPWKGVAWIGYIGQGYDTLLIVPKPGTILTVDAQTGTIAAAPDTASPAFKSGYQVALRFAVLNVLADLDTGHIYAAITHAEQMLHDHANDASFLSFAASVENAAGNWPRATQLAAKAQAIAPQNEGLARLSHELEKAHAPNVTFDAGMTRYGSDRETISTVSGETAVNGYIQIGGSIQNNRLQITDGRRPDGRVGAFSGNRRRGEMHLQSFGDSGRILKLSLFGNDRSLGLGLYDRFLSPLGETLLGAEWHRPYWDILEAAWDDATRDRLSISQTIKPTPKLTLSATPAVNRYNSEGKSGLATSVSGTFTGSYLLMDGPPALSLVYTFDGEFIQHSKYGLDASGAFTRLFPLTSREVHILSFNGSYDFNDDLTGLLSAGYAFDQIGGSKSAMLSSSLNWAVTSKIDMQLRAAYGFAGANTGSASTTVGGYVRWRF